MGEITLTPSQVREMLELENSDIIKLCKKASIVPKRNHQGLTYFSYDEVERLQQIKNKYDFRKTSSNEVLDSIADSFSNIEADISNGVLKIIDEKLNQKLKEVEEISAKLARLQGENEILKEKLSQANRENCFLKHELLNYKPLGFNLYVRVNKDYSV